jgi:uncharacterized protein
MTNCVTYSLLNNQKNSDSFYCDLGKFTAVVLGNLDPDVNDFVNDFSLFLKEKGIETLRSRNEYLLEFLMIGVYCNNYSGNALQTGSLPKKVIKTLYAQRKRFPEFKPEIDKVRGYLAYVFLEKHKHTLSAGFTLSGFISLLNWLSATGEYNEEVLRLRNWEAFCKTKKETYTAKLLKTSALFAEQFSEKGKAMLGKYVPGLSGFHQKSLPDYRYREDYFLASRRENEYFLNMFAAEVLNRELKKGFAETTKKVLLLPTCMRNEPTTGCKATSDGKELVCAACSADCNIGKVSAEMKKQGITSYLIPHSSDFSKFLVKWKDCPDTSLIGVACVLNLVTGGYEMKRLGISSQCVFLDYCGCKKHWDKQGFATSLNLNQLKQIVQKPGVQTPKHEMGSA